MADAVVNVLSARTVAQITKVGMLPVAIFVQNFHPGWAWPDECFSHEGMNSPCIPSPKTNGWITM